MDKITHQVRAEHWARILNECENDGPIFHRVRFFFWFAVQ